MMEKEISIFLGLLLNLEQYTHHQKAGENDHGIQKNQRRLKLRIDQVFPFPKWRFLVYWSISHAHPPGSSSLLDSLGLSGRCSKKLLLSLVLNG